MLRRSLVMFLAVSFATCCATLPIAEKIVAAPLFPLLDTPPIMLAAPEPPPVCTPAAPPRKDEPVHKIMDIQFSNGVDHPAVDQMISALNWAANNEVETVVLTMDSPGGDIAAAEKLVKALKTVPIPVVCIVKHQAASSAFYILQACDKRYMTEGSKIMIHEPFYRIYTPGNYTRENLEKWTKEQDEMANTFTLFACSKMNITLKECRQRVFKKDWWMTPAEAKKVNAIDGTVKSPEAVINGLETKFEIPVL